MRFFSVSPQQRKNSQQYLTVNEAAQRMGLSKEFVRLLCKNRVLAGAFKQRENGPWKIPHDDVERWIHNPNYSTTSIPQVSNKSPISLARILEKTWKVVGWTATIIGILAIVSVIADFGSARQQLADWGIYYPITPEREGEILIVVASFNYSEGIEHTEAQKEIKNAIKTALDDLNLEPGQVRVEIIPQQLAADDKIGAEKVGKKHNAHIVIWGEDTGIRVTVNFLHRKAYINWFGGDYIPQIGGPNVGPDIVTISDTNNSHIGNPSGYTQLITDNLPKQLTYFSFYAIGQSFFLIDNSKCIDILQKGMSYYNIGTTELLSDAYYWLGICYEANNQPKESLESFQYAADSEPNNALTHLHLGELYWEVNDYENSLKHFSMAIKLLKEIEISSGIIDANPDWQIIAHIGRAFTQDEIVMEKLRTNIKFQEFADIKVNNPEYTYHDYAAFFFSPYSKELNNCLEDLYEVERLFSGISPIIDGNESKERNMLADIIEYEVRYSMVLDKPENALKDIQRLRRIAVGPNLYLMEALSYEAMGNMDLALESYQYYFELNRASSNNPPEKYVINTIEYITREYKK